MKDVITHLGRTLSLAERVREGDKAAESELAARFQQRVLVMALARTRDPEASRDIVQEVLVGVLCGLREGRLEDAEKLGAYVHGVARNVVNGYMRSCRRNASGPLPILGDCTDERRGADTVERGVIVREALAGLGAEDREILRLTLVEGLRAAEIGDRLKIGAVAVRKRKSRALARARQILRTRSRN